MPEKMIIAVSKDEGARQIEIEYEFGQDLEETIELFGEETVHQAALASLKRSFSGFIKRALDKRHSDKEIKLAVKRWKYDSRVPIVPTEIKRFKNMFESLGEEEKAQILSVMGVHKDEAALERPTEG